MKSLSDTEESAPELLEALSELLATSDEDVQCVSSGGSRSLPARSTSDALKVSESCSSAMSAGPSFWPANAAPVQEAAKKPKKKRRRDRNRPNHEIARLQKQVLEMKRQLDALRPEPSASDQELQRVQDANEALRQKLLKSLEKTTAIEKLLRTQGEKLLQALPKSLVVSGRNLVYDIAADDAVFQVLAHSVDCRYQDVKRVLREAGLEDSVEEISDAQVSKTGTSSVLKYRSCSLLPYAFELVVQAMSHRVQCESAILPWNIASTRELGLPLGEASYLVVCKKEVHLEEVTLTIRMVLKWFTEADRTVHVWAGAVEWPEVEGSPHVSTREYGWSFFMPKGLSDLTVFRSFVSVTPTITPSGDEALAERVMQRYRHTIDHRYQLFENALVDGSIPSPNRFVKRKC